MIEASASDFIPIILAFPFMKLFHVNLSVSSPPPGFAFSGRDFIDAPHATLLKLCGGACFGVATDASLVLEVHALSQEH